MNPESIRIAFTGIAANKMRSALTMLGILIGVGAVIVLVAVGSGSAAAARARYESLGSNTLTISAGGLGFNNRGGTQSRVVRLDDGDVTALLNEIEAPSVKAVAPIIDATNVIATYNGANTTPRTFQGTTDVLLKVRNYEVASGTAFSNEDVEAHAKVALIGLTVAKNLLGQDGDASTLIGEAVKFGNANLTIIGILASKGTNGLLDQDDVVLAPVTTVRDLISGGGSVLTQLVVQATTQKSTESAQAETLAILLSRHAGTTSNTYRVQNQASLVQAQDATNRSSPCCSARSQPSACSSVGSA